MLTLLSVPLLRDNYVMYVAYMMFLSITLASAWNILGGFAGQISLGNAAFFGMGMYATGIVSRVLVIVIGTLELLWLVILGGAMAVGVAVILSGAFKLKGAYFAMSTLFLNEVIRILMLNWADVTGGTSGLHPRTVSPFSYMPYFYVSFAIALTSIVASYLLSTSASGVAFRCIRDDEDAALSLGINPLKSKVFAMLICAFFTGAAGACHAGFTSHIEPSSAFSINWSLIGLFATIIGGVGTIWGPIIGGVILTLISQFLIPLGSVRLLISGVLLIAFMLGAPAGMYGSLKLRWRKRSIAVKPPLTPRTQASDMGRQ